MKQKYKYFLLLGMLFSLCACRKSTEQQIAEQMSLGEKYLLEQNHEQAEVAFQNTIKLNAKQPEAYIGMADVYLMQENYNQAMKVLQEGVDETNNDEAIQTKIAEVRQDIQQKTAESAAQAMRLKLQERGNALGYIDVENYQSDKTGISSYVFCDVDADGIEELLLLYMSGSFTPISSAHSGELDECEIWVELYDFQEDEVVQIAKQQIEAMEYCDAMTVRLFFSEQQMAFCIVTNKESIGAYTGTDAFVSELYQISPYGIALKRHWAQNSVENSNDSPDDIISEMQRVGIPYMDMFYFDYGMENAETAQEFLLFSNTVEVTGDDVRERTYKLYFETYDELAAANGTDKFSASEEQYSLIQSRFSENVMQETELKESCRDVLVTLQNLLRGCDGAVLDYYDQLTGPRFPTVDDIYAAAVDFHTMEEVKTHVRSMVSDQLYDKYFDEEHYMEQNGKVYLPITTYGGSMDVDSLEIESVDRDIYQISLDEYLGHEVYLSTNLITLQKTENGWFAIALETDVINKGYTERYGGTEGNFV